MMQTIVTALNPERTPCSMLKAKETYTVDVNEWMDMKSEPNYDIYMACLSGNHICIHPLEQSDLKATMKKAAKDAQEKRSKKKSA